MASTALEFTLLTEAPLETTQINMSKKSDRLFFLCTEVAVGAGWLSKHPQSHIIGELVRVPDDEIMVTALAYYETSVPVISPPEVLPPIRMEIIGNARRIKCTCCKRLVRWEISKAAARNVIKKYAPE